MSNIHFYMTNLKNGMCHFAEEITESGNLNQQQQAIKNNNNNNNYTINIKRLLFLLHTKLSITSTIT